MLHGVQSGGAAVALLDNAGVLFVSGGNASLIISAGSTGLFPRFAPSIREKLKLKMVPSNANTDFLQDMAEFGKAEQSSVELVTADLLRNRYSMTGCGHVVCISCQRIPRKL